MQNSKRTNILLFSGAFILILLDQASKLAIKGFDFLGMHHAGLHYGQLISVIGDFLQITYVENAGMALGITFGPAKIFLSLFSIVASVALGYYLLKLSGYNIWIRLGIMLIFAGAVGNLIDRVFYGVIYNEAPLFYGRVVDFVQVDIPDINFWILNYTHFPVFNVADSCVTCGVAVLVLFHKKIPTFKELFAGKNEPELNRRDLPDTSAE